MAKLNIIQRVISPTKNSGAKKNLLKRDGITSDGLVEDDDSSSLSDRQERKQSSKSKKKFGAFKALRRMATKSSSGDIEDGYESDTSAGSTRSTSSSFLRYQNRAYWKSKLTKKSVLQRRGDGTEATVEDQTKPFPLFDKIYKRQNLKINKGDDGGDGAFSDDDDSVSSDGIEEGCPLGPPAPTFSLDFEGGECIDEEETKPAEPQDNCRIEKSDFEEKVKSVHENEGEMQEQGVLGMIRSLVRSTSPEVSASGIESLANDASPPVNSPKGSPKSPESCDSNSKTAAAMGPPSSYKVTLKPGTSSVLEDESVTIAQESGIPTAEAPKQKPVSSAAKSTPLTTSKETPEEGKPQVFPTQKLSQKKNPPVKEKNVSFDADAKEVAPTSIPRTICYSLRSAIGDGSARQRNSHSLMERRPLRPNGCSVDTSYWSHRGRRNYMEDRFVIEHLGSIGQTKKEKKENKITLMAVFDGHGGSAASQFCSDWLSSYIRKKNEYFPNNIPMAMKTAFTKMDSDFIKSGNFDGTTACACTVVGKKLICCNTGDSRAIIVKRDGTAVPLSEDHKPDRNDETKRINDLGGRVIKWGRWRVEGVLAVSRSIGDARLKPYVTAEPEIVEHDIDDDDMFLVVASDGVWDTMSSDLVAKFVLVNTCKIFNKSLHVDDKLLRWIARQISKRARENGSTDNISCIVANLKGRAVRLT